MLRVFEAFSGIGSQRMALKKIGIEHEVVGISEIDKYAAASYNAIHGETVNYGDISKINEKELPDFDLFTYSFPCQDLSLAGKRVGFDGDRSVLLFECERIIREKLPKYLLLENVKGLLNHKEGFEDWLNKLQSMGYKNEVFILNAKDFGLPQNRERVFVFSSFDKVEFNFEKSPKVTLKSVLERNVDIKYYISEDRAATFESNGKNKNIIGLLKVFNYQLNNRVYGKDSICFTLRARRNDQKIKDDKGIRFLTPLEAWRLMGFSDEDYYKSKSIGTSEPQLYKQAGNAIALNVLESIFLQAFKDELRA